MRVLLTHAHEDHVGALPYLMREMKVPEVWGTRLTLGLLQPKLDEHGLLHATELKEAVPGEPPVEIGAFKAEFVRMAHSVPDTVAIVLEAGGLRDRCTPATTSSTTRRSTACGPTWAGWRRSATAASTCCSATRRTRSDPG